MAAGKAALTHLGPDGQANMVDVGGKDDTVRTAVAEGAVTMRPETLAMIIAGNAKKGDVIGDRADCRHHGGEKDA